MRLTAALFLYKPESRLLACTSTKLVMPEHCTVTQQQQGWHVACNLPQMAWLCSDTYPNQHVGITVRALIYRWMDRDAAGVPQVCMQAFFPEQASLTESFVP